jgi:hypothetical protein
MNDMVPVVQPAEDDESSSAHVAPSPPSAGIHRAILDVMADIGKFGIDKASKNKEQNYQFRGIEAAMNRLSPLLLRHGIVITPRYSDVQFHERASKSGGTSRFAWLKGTFRFTARDGSFVESEYFGEGMDSGDKALTKAQSVAYRTALFQQFIVPTMAVDPETGEVLMSRGEELEEIAQTMIQAFNDGKEIKAYEAWIQVTDSEEQLKVWSLLRSHSTLRSTIKKMVEADRKSADKP